MNFTAQEWILIIGAIGVLATTIAGAAVTVINALKKNTVVTQQAVEAVQANTADRAEKTAHTNAVLETVASQVQDIHRGTGDGTIVVVPTPPPAERPESEPSGTGSGGG